ncbi:MAG: AAA family ATPase [Actinomycetota bacterium]|nr:AAA family ATPase [Actinomycetota bacterium]MDQ3680875.1 AAA family ATPase [Actinomycetota bacterium]
MPPEEHGAARREEGPRRKPLAFWDRTKFLILLSGAWLVLVWAAMADDPNLSFVEAVRTHTRSSWWLLVLLVVEGLRQAHYLISERSAAYHHFWSHVVFGGIERRTGGLDDWNRYRLARAFKVLLLLAVVAVLLGRVYDVSPVQGLFRLPSAIWQALPLVLQILFLMAAVVLQFVAIFWFLSKGGVDVYFPDDVKTRFKDVWGQDAVVERVKENIVFLENPESIEEKGGYVPGGLLLWGPPGTGKTLMAEAVAGETGKPYVFVDPGAFTNMFIGVGILKVKSLFRKLRKLAVRYGGVIVFFDEADALGSRGAMASGGWNGGAHAPLSWAPSQWEALTACNGMGYASPASAASVARAELPRSSEGGRPPLVARFVMGAGMGGGGMGTLQALLAELSGLKKPRGFTNRVLRRALGMRPKPPPKYRILVMMATNMPQALDEALLRPGRIDRIYKVGYPSKEGRKRTYVGYLDKVSHDLTDEQVDKLAVMTPYATGATIKDTVNEALVVAIRAGRDAITWADILKAKQLKEHGLPDEFEYIERERHAVALHEACHAVVAHRLRKHLVIDMATIERRGDVGGFVASIPPEDQFVGWKSEREADVMVFLASLAGERLFFGGDNSEGVGGDLRGATFIAMRMEGFAGMGSTFASRAITLAGITGSQMAIEDGSDRSVMDTDFGRRVEAKLAELYDRTWRLLEANRFEVLAVTHALETHRTVSGDDVVAIIEGHPGPMIDGRPYHQPEFLALAEEYHSQAVTAHEGHSKVELPLPVWTSDGHQRQLEPALEQFAPEAPTASQGPPSPPSHPPNSEGRE